MNNISADIPDKMSLRKEMLARRAAVARDFGIDEANSIRRHIREYVIASGAKYVAGYMPIGSEFDIKPVLTELADFGISLSLPVVKNKNAALIFRHWQPDQPLQRGTYGIAQPPESNRLAVPELILVPMLAFDGNGHRLGYGGGYYDRTIHEFRKNTPELATLGVAFGSQRLDAIPADKNDIALDAVATENGIERFIKCAS